MSESRSVVERYLKALGERDIPTVQEVLAEDATYWIAGSHPLSGTWTGRDTILGEFMGKMAALFDPESPYDVQVRAIVAEGPHVVVECVTRSTTIKGLPYENPIVSVFTVADGKIQGMREYFDTAFFEQTLFGDAATS